MFAFSLILLITGIFLLRKMFLIVKILGPSMSPNLQHGSRVLAFRGWLPHWLRYGDIVVFEKNGLIVKQVRGLPGDTISTENKASPDNGKFKTWYVPKGYVFLEGTDPDSLDSHSYGPLPYSKFLAIVISKI